MKTKCPYTYPAKSRKAMTEYLTSHESYGGWNHPFRGYSPLSWNVKLGRTNNDGKRGEYTTTPEFDEAWEAYCESNNGLWDLIVEDMQRQYIEGEYTTFPGDDQGRWKFGFAGRSGGHMLLEKWDDLDFLRHFSGEDDWAQWLAEIGFYTLRELYRAVRCMDTDFTRANIDSEFEYQLNFQRGQWEENHRRENAMIAAERGLEPCPAI